MLDGFNALVNYIVQHPEVANTYHTFIYEYVFGYWFVQIRPERFSVYKKDIRTNNYLESYHATLLNIIRPHPKIWEFIGTFVYVLCLNVTLCMFGN